LSVSRDWAVPVALAALGAAESWDNAVPGSAAQSVQTPAALLVALPLIWRRRAPVLVLAAVVSGFVAVWFTEHRTGGPSFAAVVSLLLALYSVGAHADRRVGRPAALAALAGLVGLLAADVASGNLRAVDAVGTFLFFPAAWLGGDVVAGRRLRVLALEQRAADLELDQDQRARAAVAEERARIAREMHDVLAHTTSMIVLQGGAARQVLRSAPDTAEQLLLSIEEIGRDALGELRRLLGLLRDDDEPAMLAPQPGLARLDCLLVEVTTAGVRVEHRVEGRPVPLPPGLDLAAYRIVQEALTNILKHAGPVPANVIVRYRPHQLELEIRNRGGCRAAPASTGDGRGLVGMRERAAMYGGSLTTRSVPGGGYLVHARLPLQRAGP
jgi:signal transduction histidine kinase